MKQETKKKKKSVENGQGDQKSIDLIKTMLVIV